MNIIKRDGRKEKFDSLKIENAIKGAFKSTNTSIKQEDLDLIINLVKKENRDLNVEEIQDIVEQNLLKLNYYQEGKNFIIYRNEHAINRKVVDAFCKEFENIDIKETIKKIQKQFDQNIYNLETLHRKFLSYQKKDSTDIQKLNILIKSTAELTSIEAPKWEFIASRFLYLLIYNESKKLNINSLYEKIKYLEKEGLYGTFILENYNEEEINELENYLDHNRNHLLTYSSLDLLSKRYVIKTRSNKFIELPQEMFLGIAMHLAMNEKNKIEWAKKIYDTISLLKITLATPTLSNSRKPHHQLSSCFIDTVPDSLDGIYRSLDNFAKVSKHGGGMGMYFGKIRSSGSSIRGFEGVAGGVSRWIKLANDTAIAVDQLGMRQGAVAVYLDIWHKDILEFLQLKTNNGDDRLKAHDIFPGICYPDLFWKKAKESIDDPWYLFCPYEVKLKMGFSLEDTYGKEWEEKYYLCINNNNLSRKEVSVKELVRLILKSVTETGTPFAFYRDATNIMNPNKHEGMIYCSNLCTEIAQNMSAIQEISITHEEGEVITRTKPGDFVVCNLASLVLGNIDVDNELEEVIKTSIRILDNVIDLNYYPLEYAKITNRKYRSLGLGTSGYHQLLAQKQIVFESEEHLEYVDKLYEEINYYAIKASNELSKEKGSYSIFKNSDWDNGDYFKLRNYDSSKWQELQKEIHEFGMRNAYLLAIAPTSSTSIIAGTTASIDPVMKKYFLEEKKGSIIPRVAPGLSKETFWFYKDAHLIDQSYVVKAAGKRGRHIDQAQSLNIYITTEYKMRQVLDLYVLAYELGVKSIYYVRSQALEVEDCISCT